MTPVRPADGSDFRGVPRSLQPVVDGGADLAPLDRRIAGPRVAGYQQDDPVTRGHCALQPVVDGPPCLVEIEAVEVDHAVGFDGAGAEAAVPGSV